MERVGIAEEMKKKRLAEEIKRRGKWGKIDGIRKVKEMREREKKTNK